MTAPTWAMSLSICKNVIPSRLYTPTFYNCSNLDQNFRLFLVLALIDPPVTKVLKAGYAYISSNEMHTFHKMVS